MSLIESKEKNSIKKYSVSEINKEISNLLLSSFPGFLIEGEISECKLSSTGHMYFNLKDENSFIKCICFSRQYSSIVKNFKFENGIKVLIKGRISTYNSSFSIVVEKIEYDSFGDILKIIQERKEKLMKEGLFDSVNKRQIPKSFDIKKLAIVTSSSGSVLHDILDKIYSHYPHNVLIYNTQVQGDNVTKGICSILDKIESGEDTPDVIIIARGGGSLEDMMSFNDESLARRAFDCKIPIISAIGHETDFCILDFVADLRCSTPTEAGILVSTPKKDDLIINVKRSFDEIRGITFSLIKNEKLKVESSKDFINGNFIISRFGEMSKMIASIPQINRLKISDLFSRISFSLTFAYKELTKVQDFYFGIIYRQKALIHDSAVGILNKCIVSVSKHSFVANVSSNDFILKLGEKMLLLKKKMENDLSSNIIKIQHIINESAKSIISSPDIKLLSSGFMVGYKNGKRINDLSKDIKENESFDLISKANILKVKSWSIKKRFIKGIDLNVLPENKLPENKD